MTLGPCPSLTPDEACEKAEQGASPQLLTNFEKAPSQNDDATPPNNLHQPQFYKCPKCDLPQPIRMACARCGGKRTFRCFANSCVKPNQLMDFQCRYCQPIKRAINISESLFSWMDWTIDWLQQEKVHLYFTKTRTLLNNRFLIPESIPNTNECIENYCYLCGSPIPIAKDCKRCKKFYTFRCAYPPKCVKTVFPDHLGTDRWDNCPECLGEQQFELLDAEKCCETESNKFRHDRILRCLDELSETRQSRCHFIRDDNKCCRFIKSVCDAINVLSCVALSITLGLFCLYFIF